MEDFYYGLPQSLWDDLSCLAEENLEKEICFSAHMLGLYPYGPRLYGKESESPGLLCLYLDSSINKFFDPFIKERIIEPERIVVKTDNSFIYYIDLWSWLVKLDCKVDMIHMVPCLGDILHEDSSIQEIISLSRDLISVGPVKRNCTWTEEKNLLSSPYNLRTSLVFAQEKLFRPCVKDEWDSVYKFGALPEEIRLIDNKVLGQEKLSQEELNKYRTYVFSMLDKIDYSDSWWKTRSELQKEVIKYFRFQL
jgi:hypothetical protein